MLTSSKHRLITLLATLMFAGYLHSATLDESLDRAKLDGEWCFGYAANHGGDRR